MIFTRSSLALNLWLGVLASDLGVGLVWDLCLGIYGLGSLACNLKFGIGGFGVLGFGSSAWELRLGIFGLETLALRLWLGIYCFGALVLDL